MNRTRGILAAGALTGLVLITALVLGFGNLQAKQAVDPAANQTTVESKSPATEDVNNEQALQDWQTYSAELEQTVRTMQLREFAYQQQLEAANQVIVQLQTYINGPNNAPLASSFEEHEAFEHESREAKGFDD